MPSSFYSLKVRKKRNFNESNYQLLSLRVLVGVAVIYLLDLNYENIKELLAANSR